VKVAFLGLPESERRLYIEEAAARRSVSGGKDLEYQRGEFRERRE
jgi:hypothetical protein